MLTIGIAIVAACIASGQERQLHSHLHGALNVGVGAAAVRQALDAIEPAVDAQRIGAARRLFDKVVGK